MGSKYGVYDKQELVDLLLDLPGHIEAAERDVAEALSKLGEAKLHIAKLEAEAILSGRITGKNEAERKAQLTLLTEEAQKAIMAAEQNLAVKRIDYNYLSNKFKAVMTVARLMCTQTLVGE